MKCEICGQGPADGISVYRTGEKGEGVDPHWRCKPHLPPHNEVDEGVIELTEHLEEEYSKLV